MPRYVDMKHRLTSNIELVGECWIWQGKKRGGRKSEYGRINVYDRESGRTVTKVVHRVAYEEFIAPIPEGYHVDHKHSAGCRSTLCINPDHLEAVPIKINMARRRPPVKRRRAGHNSEIVEPVNGRS